MSLIIFDLDDTLYANYEMLFPKATRLVSKALVQAGIPKEEDELYDRIIELYPAYDISISIVMRKILEEAGIDDKRKQDKMIAIAKKAYDSVGAEGISLYPGIAGMLERLRHHHILVLMTMGSIRLQNNKIDNLSIRGFFDFVEIVDSSEGTKEEAIKRFMNENDFSHKEAVFVGDRPDNDIEAANNAGLKTIRLKKWKYAKCEPQNEVQKADVTVTDPLDVEKAIEQL